MNEKEIYLERGEILTALKFSSAENYFFKTALKYKYEAIKNNLSESKTKQEKESILENYILEMLNDNDFCKGLDFKISVKKRNILLWNIKRVLSNRSIVEEFQLKLEKNKQVLTYRDCLDWLSVMN